MAGLIFAFLLVLFVVFSLKGMVEVYKLRLERQTLNKEISVIKKSNKKMSKRIYKLRYSKQYIADLAREELNMIKKGEIVFKFIGQKGKNTGKTSVKHQH
ncbi:FtsB family cell division protein [Candidatus Acidulodesulfobacterium sp. H_13]|uniref:FtsB family cell division protein n=1 Tax=Candidatus Acidulodesulfobacterium sp. H_13 TaxID=3395470 RepID=UPI003AF66FB4